MKLYKTIAIVAMAATLGSAMAQEQGGPPPPPPGGFGQGPGGPGGPPGMRGPGGGMRMGGPGLLMMPEVQKELKLSDEQIQKIHALMPPPPPMRDGGGEGGPPPGPPPRMPREEMDKQLKGILDSNQFTRLQQLQLQQQGPFALTRPEVQDKLGLSQDQKDKIRAVMEQNRPTPPPQGGQMDRNQMMAQRKAQREKLTNELLTVLTSDQKATWKNMLGQPFKFPEMPMRMRGPGGPGGPGGPPPPGGGNGGPPPPGGGE